MLEMALEKSAAKLKEEEEEGGGRRSNPVISVNP